MCVRLLCCSPDVAPVNEPVILQSEGSLVFLKDVCVPSVVGGTNRNGTNLAQADKHDLITVSFQMLKNMSVRTLQNDRLL